LGIRCESKINNLIPGFDTLGLPVNSAGKATPHWVKSSVANIVRYVPSGIYFARAKVGGKLIRQSLAAGPRQRAARSPNVSRAPDAQGQREASGLRWLEPRFPARQPEKPS